MGMPACKKKTLIDEQSVEGKILVNQEDIYAIHSSDVDSRLVTVEQKMDHIIQAVQFMEPDTTDPEVLELMTKSEKGLKDAQGELRKVLKRIEKNRIPEAEEKLGEIITELDELENEIAGAGY